MSQLPLDPVVLSMLDIRPHLENVLKYIHALGRHHHLPPSTLTFDDLCNEDRRAELVTYVIGFAGECALEKLDDLDSGGFDPDGFDPDPDDPHPLAGDDEFDDEQVDEPGMRRVSLSHPRPRRSRT